MTCSSVGFSPDKWVELENTVLLLLHSSQYGVCQSLWMFSADSGAVDAGVRFLQVSKSAVQNSRGRVSMARRNVRYPVQAINNSVP